jgi:hypothetical protein
MTELDKELSESGKVTEFCAWIDEGWSIKLSMQKAGISDRKHWSVYRSNVVYRNKVLTYFRKNKKFPRAYFYSPEMEKHINEVDCYPIP